MPLLTETLQQFKRILYSFTQLLAVTTLAVLGACGGGGDNDNNNQPANSAPQAEAGMDITADANASVTLNGSASTDSDGMIVSYSWTQLSGNGVTLSDATTAEPNFTAPALNGDLVFQLTVTDDDGATAMDTVTVSIINGTVMPGGLDARPDNMNCIAPATAGQTPGTLSLVDPFPNLNLTGLQFLLGMKQMPGNNNYFFAITRGGRLVRFDNDPNVSNTTLVLDISSKVNDLGSEGGLLGFAFHPQVANNRAVYLSYTTTGGGSAGQSIVSRFTLSSDFSTIDPASERQVLQVDQPFPNHNGGDIHFGPDGYLYFGLGDGGSANDPDGNGQNTNTLLGSMLRIDVDPTTNMPPFYSIPPDNPFAVSGGLPEIYAYGLRNPFRWSFDPATGVLWLADVGQSAREEVDQITKGGNYGWDLMEGNICRISDCSAFIAPIHDYDRTVGTSITGGYIYRGTDVPTLDGAYVFGDFGSGRIWTLTPSGSSFTRTQVATPSGSIISFAQDNAGEVYVLLGFPNDGRSIRKVAAGTGGPGSNIPTLLSATGCFDSSNPAQPDAGLIAYDVINPLWSDGAVKQRWMALPNGATVGLDMQGDFDFPVGTILAKHFANAGIMIETRLLMLHQTGWAGYSYKWRGDQSDADLLPGADDDTVAGLDWHFPSGAECRQCHTPVKNFALGPEVLQLNHDFTYPSTGRTANQVFTLNSIGVFSTSVSPALGNARLFALDDVSTSLESRVKSYLHSNCSNCHQPGGTGGTNMDFRFQTPLSNMNICNVAPQDDLGIAGAQRIAPGSPGQSIILERMQRLDQNRMPPLASNVVDAQAVSVFTDWINSLSSCP